MIKYFKYMFCLFGANFIDDDDDDDDDEDDDDNYFLLRVDFLTVTCYWFMVLWIATAMLHLTFILHSFLLTPRISFLVIGSNFGSAEIEKSTIKDIPVLFL